MSNDKSRVQSLNERLEMLNDQLEIVNQCVIIMHDIIEVSMRTLGGVVELKNLEQAQTLAANTSIYIQERGKDLANLTENV